MDHSLVRLPDKAGPYEVATPSGVVPIDLCPGALVRQPAVADVEKAYWALEKNALELYLPRPSRPLLEAVALLGQAMARYEADRLKTE